MSMQRPQGISAHVGDAPGEPDAGVALSAALRRLAALRATIHGDWSQGLASLLDVANEDILAGATLCWAVDPGRTAAALELISKPAAEEPLSLRGRFTETTDALPAAEPVDASWLDLMSGDSRPAARSMPGPDVSIDEIAVALAFAEDCEAALTCPAAEIVSVEIVDAAPEPTTVETNIVAIDDIEPAFAIGTAPGVLALVRSAVADVTPPVARALTTPLAPEDDDAHYAIGAVAGIGALLFADAPDALECADSPAHDDGDDIDPQTFLAFCAAPGLLESAHIERPVSTPARKTLAVVADDDPVAAFPCATFDLHTLLALAEPVAVETPAAPALALLEEEAASELAVGAFPICLDVDPETTLATPIVATAAAEEPAPLGDSSV